MTRPSRIQATRWPPAPNASPLDAPWIERIEAVRAALPPPCPSCETISTGTRRCSRCRVVKPLVGGFGRDRHKPLGYRYECLDCRAGERARQKKAAFRAIIGRSS